MEPALIEGLTSIFREITIRVWVILPLYCNIYMVPAGAQERRGEMATGALMIGWGSLVRGREQKALEFFNEAIQHYTSLQQQGTIESFEPVLLEPHGGDLQGFILIRGDREKLNALRSSEEFLHMTNRADLLVDNLGIVTALIGEELQRVTTDFQTQVSELS